MGDLIHGRIWWWNKLRQELFNIGKYSKGNINLSFGRHEVFIPIPAKNLRIRVGRVYVSCEGLGDPVCQGGVDLANPILIDEGFVIYAEIAHDTSTVYWLFEYDLIDDGD